jgi:hypothetical protein
MANWQAYEAKAREVAMSLPPSDFGSHRAIVAFAKTLEEAVEPLRDALQAYADARLPDGWNIVRLGDAHKLARAALASAQPAKEDAP